MTAAAAVLALAAGSAGAAEFRWASQSDPTTMDAARGQTPAPVHSFLNNVYEGLVRRGKDMSLEPALANVLGADRHRRLALPPARGRDPFHGGQAFDADDVLFSYRRAASEQSDVRSFFASVSEGREGRRLHGRVPHQPARPAAALGHRQLHDPGRGLGDRKRGRGTGARRGDPRHLQRQRHRRLSPGRAPAGHAHGAGAVRGLVGRGGAQHHPAPSSPRSARRPPPSPR